MNNKQNDHMYGEKNLEKTFWVPDENWSQDLPDGTRTLFA